ncbi:hypothetical protein [Rhodanobacter lindaniclasticus]
MPSNTSPLRTSMCRGGWSLPRRQAHPRSNGPLNPSTTPSIASEGKDSADSLIMQGHLAGSAAGLADHREQLRILREAPKIAVPHEMCNTPADGVVFAGADPMRVDTVT